MDSLYNKQELREKKGNVVHQLIPVQDNEQFAVLAVSESNIQIEEGMKQRMMQVLQTDDQYAEMMIRLQDPIQANEWTINNKTYKIKSGLLRIHEKTQPEQYSYWRTVVPDDQGIKREVMKEIHCVPYARHPGFTKTLEVTRRFFYLSHMTQEVC